MGGSLSVLGLFSRRSHWSLRQLMVVFKGLRDAQAVKAELGKYCSYDRGGEFRGTYALKPEYAAAAPAAET